MKRNPLVRFLPARLALLVAPLLAAWPQRTHAASGAWNVDANGNWTTTGSWLPAAVPGTAAGDVIDFLFNITAARTATIDTTSRTAGDVNIGDPTATLFGYTLASSGTAVVLNLDGTGTTDATVDFRANIANTISAPLTLVDNAVFRSNVAGVQTLSGVISGTGKTVTFNNDTDGTANAAVALNGQFLVTGANTYTGGTTISDVRVNITTNNTALGAAGSAVTIPDGGQVFASTGLATINYAFNIAGNGWVETTAGQPLGALRLEGGPTITGPVTLSANAAVGGNGAGTINGIISGGFVLSKRGTGTTILGGANTYSGGTVIGNGSFQLNNNAGAGTGEISLVAGGAGTPTRLLVNGGVTAANNINIGATFNVAGSGVLQQTGTGAGTLNGTINITGSPSAGGHLVGGNSATNALVLNGPITSSFILVQRDGFVRYAGGGTGYNALQVSGTAQLGTTNGIATTAVPQLGVSVNAVLDLNGFNQTLPSISLGNGGANSILTGTIALGGNTLSLGGDLTTLNNGTGNVSNAITAAAGGNIDFGAAPRSLVVADNSAADDLVVTAATINGAGGLTKAGAGTLALNGASITAPLTVSTGGIQIGTSTAVGTATIGSVNFADETTLRMKAGTTSDLLTVSNAGGFVNNGQTNLIVNQSGGVLPNGSYPLIAYTGASPGTGTFNLSVGHATASLVDASGVISLNVTGNDRVIWDGTNSGEWATGVTGNWKRQTGLAATDYVESDDVIFQDSPTANTVNLAANVFPSNVTFTNNAATPYTLTGTGTGIRGTAALTKTGNGTLTLSTQNAYAGATTISEGTVNLTAGSLSGSNVTVAAGATLVENSAGSIAGSGVGLTTSGTVTLGGVNPYTGATAVNAGTLELDHDAAGNVVLTGSSGVSIASGAMLRLTRDDGGFTFSRNLSGAGTIEVNPRTAGPGTTAVNNFFSGDNSGFTGNLRLLPPFSGTYRLQQPTVAQLGAGTIEVGPGAQLYTAANLTYTNDVTLSGVGYQDSGGFIGAMRLEGGSNWAGDINVGSGGARIGSHNATGTVSGSISGGELNVNGSDGNFNNNYTVIFTGANSYGKTTIGGGSTATAVSSRRLNIGNGGTTGTLGSGVVEIIGDAQNGVLGFDRSNGYTLLPGQSITGVGSQPTRTFVDIDTTGAGFNDNGNTITLGAAENTAGGQFRIGVARPNTLGNYAGNLTAGKVSISTAAVGTGSVTNINSGAVWNIGYFSGGEAANASGTVNQAAGSTVNVTNQFRAGHFGTETMVYNMNGGTFTMTGPNSTLTPSTSAAGGNSATGDNNVDAAATAVIVGGGIYLGIDGQGVFNQNAGTVTTNWIVLDNRGDSGAGANMSDGIDRYNLNGGTLNLRGNWGLIGRNNSTLVSLGNGTVRVDNTGTGPGTGANLTVPLDANIIVNGAATLDTNGAGNSFTVPRSVFGAGSLALTGGGIVNLTTTGTQLVMPSLSTSGAGANLTKLGAGTTILAGSGVGFTGGVTVSAGRLDLPSNITPSSLSLAAGTILSGEPSVSGTTTFNGASLVFDPNSAAVLTTGVLDVNGVNTLDISTIPVAAGPWTALNYGSKTGAGTFSIANPGNYRTPPAVVDTGSSITLNVLQGKTIAWTGAVSNAWNINSATNWLDTNPPGLPENFFNADIAVFADGGLNTSIALSGTILPLAVVVTSNSTNYTLTSTAGNQLSGPAGITKTGASTLTLAGPNLHAGATDIGGGSVSIALATSLGNGSGTNGIALSNGGTLIVTGANDLGAARALNVAATGGGLTMANAAAQTVTVSGNVTGSGPLAFRSTLAGGGTFVLSGNNAGYAGDIDVSAVGTGITGLTIANQAAAPSGGSIKVNYPPAGANANACSLNLPNISLPAAVTLNMTSLTSGALSLRSQVAATGTSVINGPITASGSAIVQFNAGSASTLTLNGNLTEAGPFNNVFFFRGAGTHVLNGTFNFPTAGSAVSVTDGATFLVNTTGNVASGSQCVFGTIRLGINDALPTTGTLLLGQAGDQVCTVDLNGFNQTVSTLSFAAPTGNLLTKGISNTHPSATSTFTVNQAADTSFNGTLSGRINLVKEGASSLTLPAAASTFSGSLSVNNGTLVGSSLGAAAGGNGCLGVANLAGRQISVNSPGVLSFTSNNIFGNGVGNANLPTLNITGATTSSTRYNTIGPVVLNGGTLAQSATDSGAYEGYQFKGAVTVGGASPSTISSGNGKANHLDANTIFTVGDATASSAPDLVVGNPLRNQSGDFAQATGGLTKAGAGTMQLAAGTTHSYTGATNVNGGVLMVDGTVAGSPVAVNAGGTIGGIGTLSQPVVVAGGGTVAPGASVGTLNFGATLTLNAGSIYAVEITGAATSDKVIATGALTANGTISVTLTGYVPVSGDTFDIADASSITGTPTFDFSAAVLTAGLVWDTATFAADGKIKVTVPSADPFDAWAASFGLTGGKNGDDDLDGASNLLEFATNSNPATVGSGANSFARLHPLGGDNVLTLTIAVRKSAVFTASGAPQSATKDKVIYTVEATDNLANWTTVVVTELNAADSAAVQAALSLPTLDADWEWHSFRTDGGTTADPRDMIRLSVASEP